MLAWAKSFTLGCPPTHTSDVANVDPDDDNIQRYVVRRYAHDPERHERRHQVVAAFDDKTEFLRLLERLNDDLERRREAGAALDLPEHYTGLMLEPGYSRQQKDSRIPDSDCSPSTHAGRAQCLLGHCAQGPKLRSSRSHA